MALASAAALGQTPAVKTPAERDTDQPETSAPEAPPVPPPPKGPADNFGRGVPRTSVAGFQEAAEAGDWERAVEYLDLRSLPRGLDLNAGPEFARQLATVLGRALWIDPATLSDEPEGHADDDLPSYRDFVGRVETPTKQIDILLQRVPRGDGVSIWKFSNRTIAQLPFLHRHFGFGPLGELLSKHLPSWRIQEVPLWEWVGVLILASGSAAVAWLVMAPIAWIVRRSEGGSELMTRLLWPVTVVFFVAILRGSVWILGPTFVLRAIIGTKTLVLIAMAWLAMRLGELLVDRSAERLRRRERPAFRMLGRPARNFVRGFVVLVALVIWLDNLGIEITTLIAGLGIGGLALALAAQSSIEDLIGAFTIICDPARSRG